MCAKHVSPGPTKPCSQPVGRSERMVRGTFNQSIIKVICCTYLSMCVHPFFLLWLWAIFLSHTHTRTHNSIQRCWNKADENSFNHSEKTFLPNSSHSIIKSYFNVVNEKRVAMSWIKFQPTIPFFRFRFQSVSLGG